MMIQALSRDLHTDRPDTRQQVSPRLCPARAAEPHEPLPIHEVRIPTPLARTQAGGPATSSDSMQQRLQTFLSEHLKERVTLKDLSNFLGYSQKYCSEFFRVRMGVCFSHYVKTLRITRATGLLRDHDLPLAHIAERLGFSDSFAFSHFFKRVMGCSPSEFRRQQVVQVGLR